MTSCWQWLTSCTNLENEYEQQNNLHTYCTVLGSVLVYCYLELDMTKQPTALWLADEMDKECADLWDKDAIQDELRRLHDENTKLWGWYHDAEQRIAILEGRAKGEQK